MAEDFRPEPGSPFRMPRPGVCIIDEDAAVRDALTALLQAYGYEALAFARCGEFLAGLHPLAVGCIVLDPYMQDAAELQAVRAGGCRTGPVPVIVITRALNRVAAEDETRELLFKPFTPEQLLAGIRRALDAAA